MKALSAMAAAGLGLMCLMGSASAQWGRPDYGYRDRDSGYGERGPGYRERDYGDRERGPGYRQREYGFNEREYLRCNPDVARAVMGGRQESGLAHYQAYGRREGRRVRC